MFFRGSRYETVATAELTTAEGRLIRHKRIRFIPEVEGRVPYQVAQGDRLDLIANRFYSDPERFWLICDGNLTLRPDDLVSEPGRRLRIPLELR